MGIGINCVRIVVKEGRKSMNAADFTNYKQIKEFHIFDGDFPAINYEYKDGKLYTYNRINGSRDGRMRFPDGFFDTIEVPLNDSQRQQLSEQLSSLCFSNWTTDETVFDKMGCPGFCIDLNNIQNLPPKKGLLSSLFGKK